MPIYIVSGFMRSGTSCMMKALEAGGLEAVYNPDRDIMNKQHGDENYQINSGGFYELNGKQYQHPDFPDNHEGKLVKYLWGGMPLLRASESVKHIIFMRRPVVEIAASYEAAFGSKHPQAIPELDAKLDRIQDILAMRRDVRLSVVDYRNVLLDPIGIFLLLEKRGFQIDYSKSAAIVDVTQYRHKGYSLTRPAKQRLTDEDPYPEYYTDFCSDTLGQEGCCHA